MTTAAREVLDVCREAFAELDGAQRATFRRRWITAVVLLRAVGHVLHKIDGEQSQQHTEPIRQWWEQLKSKPRPHIFWNFIEEERNTILKEYRTLAREDVSIRLGGTQLAFNAPPDATRHDLPGTTEYHYTMRDGPFKGRDPRDLIREGIQWWEDELEIIEAAVRKQRRTDR